MIFYVLRPSKIVLKFTKKNLSWNFAFSC